MYSVNNVDLILEYMFTRTHEAYNTKPKGELEVGIVYASADKLEGMIDDDLAEDLDGGESDAPSS
jgi:hypothetical protein